MSAQAIGARKLRRLCENTGLDLDRALRVSNSTWLGRVLTDDGHVHIRIDPRTYQWTPEDGPNVHWTSCGTLADTEA